MFEVANVGLNSRRIVQCNGSTLNTPYKAGLVGDLEGTAYVNMSNQLYGTVLYITSGNSRVFLASKKNGNWSAWSELISNTAFITKIVSLNKATVPANAGTDGLTTNIASQIPDGYRILDAREVGSGNNGCYIYYFKVDGTNITIQLRNVTNTAITTSPAAKLLLIPK